MAGHSKWANIKHRKARQDASRGKVWTKVIREITSGCLDMNINIVDARIFSNKRNVIDILWIQDNFGKKIVDKNRLSRIKEKILLFINEDEIPLINYEDNIDKRSSAFNILPDVSIYNSLSKKYSVIEREL